MTKSQIFAFQLWSKIKCSFFDIGHDENLDNFEGKMMLLSVQNCTKLEICQLQKGLTLDRYFTWGSYTGILFSHCTKTFVIDCTSMNLHVTQPFFHSCRLKTLIEHRQSFGNFVISYKQLQKFQLKMPKNTWCCNPTWICSKSFRLQMVLKEI